MPSLEGMGGGLLKRTRGDKYIWGIVTSKGCKLYRINGMEDHIHILSDLHPSISLSNFVKEIKVASSLWLKASKKFKMFEGWQEGYAAFTYSIKEKDHIINYIKNQRDHHTTECFYDEIKRLLSENQIGFNSNYLV